jgi:hypothetical protein
VDVARIAGYVGLLLHVVVGVVYYASSGLVAPLWAIVVLGVWWVVLLVIAWRLLRERPALVLAVPAVAWITWFLAIAAGERLLGWTA